MNINPVCPGQNCPLKQNCARYKYNIDVMKESNMPYALYDKIRKKCGWYVGNAEPEIMNKLKDIVDGHKSED